jgi:hypothetical protein
MFVQTIVCFANSRKNGNRCIAGKTWARAGRGRWVRPVSRSACGALNPALLAYQDGAQPTLMDIVRVPLDGQLPQGHQRENALSSDDYFWTRTGRLRWPDIGEFIDEPAQLWTPNHHSGAMLNNRVPVGLATGSSLQLIKVPVLQLSLIDAPTPADPYRRVVAGEFVYHGATYRLSVTDPEMEALCRAQPRPSVVIAQPVLCVSLGLCFMQYHYKLIAGVLYEGRFS